MAESRPTEDDDPLEEVVTCKICFIQMEEAQILFPCMHSFCTECVSRLPRSRQSDETTISCPMCRADILEKNIHKNQTMAEFIDIVRAKKQRNDQKKDLKDTDTCVQCDDNNINFICVNCDVKLCDNCARVHARLPKCKDKLLKLVEAVEIQKNTPVFCSKHQHKQIKMNCTVCNKAICSECKFQDHDTHKSESLDSALERYRNMMDKSLESVKKTTSLKRKLIADKKEKMDKVKANSIQAQSEIDKKYEEIMSQLQTEKESLCSDVEMQCGAQLKELQLEVESLEQSVSCVESIQTWTDAVMTNTDGGGLLIELQSGLFNRLQQLQQEGITQQPDTNCKVYTFKPSRPSPLLLGQVLSSNIETGVNSFRLVDFNLDTLVMRKLTVQSVINVGQSAVKLCLFQDKIYVPCYKKNMIKVFDLIKNTIEIKKLQQHIKFPKYLHPLNQTQFVLACETGLFTLDKDTLTVISQMSDGDFGDVYVDGDTLAALRKDDKKVYLWTVSQMSQPKHSFCVVLGDKFGTICIYDKHVYVCDLVSARMYKYNMEGHLQVAPCDLGMSLHNSPSLKLCLADRLGKMLLADGQNNCFILLSTCGKWYRCGLEVQNPRDVVMHNNILYVLNNSGVDKTITTFQL